MIAALSLSVSIMAEPESVHFQKYWGPGKTVMAVESMSRAVEDETDGKGEPDLIVAPIRDRSFKRENLYFDIKIDKMENVSGFEIRLGDKGFANYYALSIPLFEDPDFNIIQDKCWQTYSFGLSNARVVGRPPKKVNRFGIYTQDNGKGPIHVAVRKIRFRPAPATGYVSLTFDDGYLDTMRAAEIMGKYNFPGTAYIMPRQIGTPGYLSLAQLRELKKKYHWGISAHHAIPYTDFTPYALNREIRFTLNFLASNGFAVSAPHLAYPLGKQDRDVVLPIVRRYFETARVAGGGVETLPPADPYLLRTVNVLDTTKPEDLVKVVKNAVDNGQWAILMFHYLVTKPKTPIEYRKKDFVRFIDLLAQAQVPVLPVDAVYRKFHSTMAAHANQENVQAMD